MKSEDEQIASAEMMRIYKLLDNALAAWVSKLSPLKQQILVLILEEQIKAPTDTMYLPGNLRKMGLFYHEPGFPQLEFEAMVEAYICFFAIKFRKDMIPPPPKAQEGYK